MTYLCSYCHCEHSQYSMYYKLHQEYAVRGTSLWMALCGAALFALLAWQVFKLPAGLDSARARAGSYENSLKIAGVIR